MTRQERFDELYENMSFSIFDDARLRDDLILGQKYGGVVYTPAHKKAKGKRLFFPNRDYLFAKVIGDKSSELLPTSREMVDFLTVRSEVITLPALKVGTHVMIDPDADVSRYPNASSLLTIQKEKEFAKVVDINYHFDYYSNFARPVISYIIETQRNDSMVSNDIDDCDVIPLTEREYLIEVVKINKQKEKEKRKRERALKDLSETTRQNLINSLVIALEERHYIYSRNALETMIEEWYLAKKPLIKLLSKHPNWNKEKFLIQFDTDYTRERDQEAVDEFVRILSNHYYCAYKLNDGVFSVLDVLNKIETVPQIITEAYVDEFAAMCKTYSIDTEMFPQKYYPVVGMKASRWVRKLVTGFMPDVLTTMNFEKAFAIFADAINPLAIKRHTCLSLNPTDFLLQSNGNSWRSCHYIGNDPDDSGCYCSGTISYMLDSPSMVFYTVDGGYNGNQIELEKKITRCMFAYKNGVLLQQRVYPQSTDGNNEIYKNYRAIVQGIITSCLDEPNLWKVNHNAPSFCMKGSGSTMYHDWFEQSSSLSSISLLNSANIDADPVAIEEKDLLVIGAAPISIKTGYRHGKTSEIY